MGEYTAQLDAQITSLLNLRGRVSADDLAGISAEDAVGFLSRYAEVHAGEADVLFDGHSLVSAASEAPLSGGYAGADAADAERFDLRDLPPIESPTDAVAHYAGTSALDTKTSAGFSAALWLVPVVFAVLGGAVAWFMLRDIDRKRARDMFVVGIVSTVLQLVLGLGIPALMGGPKLPTESSLLPGRTSTPWPVDTDGQLALYYFGTPASEAGKQMSVVVDRLSSEYTGLIDFTIYADVASSPAVSRYAVEQGVKSEPTMVLVSATGVEIARFKGVQSEVALRTSFDKALSEQQ
jgi:hypothetical protein